jgi:hypothetical protein
VNGTANVPSAWKGDFSGLSLVYINQQNNPVVQKLVGAKAVNGTVTFTSPFPYAAGAFGNGLTLAAVALATGDLTSADGVAAATLFGPGIIEI